MKYKDTFIQITIEIAYGIVIFCLVRWLGTDNNWLAFFIAWAISNSTFQNIKKELLRNLLPIFNDVDRNINGLYEKTTVIED